MNKLTSDQILCMYTTEVYYSTKYFLIEKKIYLNSITSSLEFIGATAFAFLYVKYTTHHVILWFFSDKFTREPLQVLNHFWLETMAIR